jgi:L-iditol 2-dehydrogenase/galactitol-1-phosphate 5-dehydrogenase
VSSILRRELKLYGTWNSKITPAGKSEWDMVIHHMQQGDLKITPLISHVLPLSDGPQMFANMADRSIWYNKVVFAIANEATRESASQERNEF